MTSRLRNVALLAVAVIVNLGDMITFPFLPAGAELNPLASTYPGEAILLRAVLLMVFVWLYARSVFGRAMTGFYAGVGTIALYHNLAIIWR